MDGESVKDFAAIARENKIGILPVEAPDIHSGPIPLALLRDEDGGFKIEGIKHLLEPWREFPERRIGTSRLLTLQSLIDLVNRHKDEGSAVFGDFADATRPKISVVLDYHEASGGRPRHGTHRAEYAFPVSDEWRTWMAKNTAGDKVVSFDQAKFAAFLEDRIADLSSPYDQERTDYEPLFGVKFAGAHELLTLSRGLELNVTSKVKEFRNLQSGETQITFDEVHEDGKGKPIKVPGLFVVQIPLFVGGEKVRIITRLRYRKADGGVVWFFQMYRPDIIMRERVTADLAMVGEETGLPTFEGLPESDR